MRALTYLLIASVACLMWIRDRAKTAVTYSLCWCADCCDAIARLATRTAGWIDKLIDNKVRPK